MTRRPARVSQNAAEASLADAERPRTPRKASVSAQTATALSGLTERVFQAHVVAGLRQRGYLVFVVPDMRRTTRGLPDVLGVKPGRLLAWELKSARGRVRPEQQQIINCLQGIPGVDARIVRPADWARLKEEV